MRALVEQHYELLWRSLRRFGVPEEAVDDAVQQALIVVARKIDEIRPGEERSYLLGVAVRIAANVRRGIGRRHQVPEEEGLALADPRLSPDELLERKQARELLDRVLAAMPHDLRTAFVLFELEGLTAPELAHVMAVPLGTAASRLRRAREQFREGVRKLVAEPGGAP